MEDIPTSKVLFFFLELRRRNDASSSLERALTLERHDC